MPIRFRCQQCGLPLVAPDGAAGRRAKCGSCGTRNQIPEEAVPAILVTPTQLPSSRSARPEVVPLQRAAGLRQRHAKAIRHAISATPVLCFVAGYVLRMLMQPAVPDVDARVETALVAYQQLLAEREFEKVLTPTAKVSEFLLTDLSPNHARAYGASEELLRAMFQKSGFGVDYFDVDQISRGEPAVGSPPERQIWLFAGTINGDRFIAHAQYDAFQDNVAEPAWRITYGERGGKPFRNFAMPIPGLPVGVSR